MRKPSGLVDIFSLNPDASDSVGARIRLLRQRRGLTQEGLAGALSVSRSAIALWATDRGGEVRHLDRLADVLGVRVEFFVNGHARHDITRTLTMDENALLELYRSCPPSDRLTLMRTAGRLLKQAGRRRAAGESAAVPTAPAPRDRPE